MNSLTPEALRARTKKGKFAYQRVGTRAQKAEVRRKRTADLEEAKERIKEAEGKRGSIVQAASRGKNEVQVCVLRGGLHFQSEFYQKQSPRFLGTIGKVIYKHFRSRGLKVSFRHWMDAMRIGELEEDGGYEVIVSW